jgi:diguanylate cyclase (GGDEF)-like protein
MVDCKADIKKVAKLMIEKNIGCVLVNKNDKFIGIFTERDFVRCFSSANGKSSQSIEKLITKNPICAQIHEDYHLVHMRMKVHNIRHLPIMNKDKLVGIVSVRDLLRYYQNQIETDLFERKDEIKTLQKLVNLTDNEVVDKLMKEVKRFEEISLTDDLTGLYNVRYFRSRLREETERARRNKKCLSLIFCDIDYFKQINDKYGHQQGDKILVDISKKFLNALSGYSIISKLRKSDIVARYGGEEFVIILPEIQKKNGLIVAERLRKAIAIHKFKNKHEKLKITMSFGIAEFQEDAKNDTELIKNADIAMYMAKEKGRNRCEVYAKEVKSR